MAVLNLSFAACGFLGIYQLGAVRAILRHGDKLLGSLRACAGASAGALVAAVLVTAPDKLENCKAFTYRFASDVRTKKLGAMTPGYDFMLTLREGIEDILPSDAHSLAGNRLHVSITHSRSGKNRIISSFSSREELIKALLASSFVPVYAGFSPVEFQGQKWIDGGFTDSLPILPEGRTITVCPFAGPQDVCPHHRGRTNLRLKLANMDIMFSKENMLRLNQALFPPSASRMKELCQEGYEDAVRFLKKEDWMHQDLV
ncbi:patatin-like phospholipase domain-containing protein 4 [Osmerus eperlanus]|uniref:patatin-like phospholipase domain-containing protein 4 n=1 Tax=Osmerus eperlanus TaxID=29151 RepID=UPI002E129EDD